MEAFSEELACVPIDDEHTEHFGGCYLLVAGELVGRVDSQEG